MVALLDPRNSQAPGRGTEGEATYEAAGRPLHTIAGTPDSERADTLATFTPEDAARVAGGAFVVATHTYGDRHVRRVHLTLAAAQRAVERAEDRGHQAHIVLSRIVPVGVVS